MFLFVFALAAFVGVTLHPVVAALVAAADMPQEVTAVVLGTAIAGFLAPFLIPLINRPQFSDQAKRLIALGVGVVLAVLSLWITGGFDLGWTAIAATILSVIGLSQTLYAIVVKPTGASDAIEKVTSPSNVG